MSISFEITLIAFNVFKIVKKLTDVCPLITFKAFILKLLFLPAFILFIGEIKTLVLFFAFEMRRMW